MAPGARSFYDRGVHGVDWRGVLDKYMPMVVGVSTHEELSDVMQAQMVGELWHAHLRARRRHAARARRRAARVAGRNVHAGPGARADTGSTGCSSPIPTSPRGPGP